MFSEIILLLTAYDFNSINYNNIAEKRLSPSIRSFSCKLVGIKALSLRHLC